MSRKAVAAALLVVIGAGADENRDRGRPDAVAARAVRPEVFAGRVLDLFRGARFPDPASALAAWKRAGAPRADLGKPLEAAIAAVNPLMAREWRSVDGATFAAGPGGWRASVPRDDGTLAAFAVALALTDGATGPSDAAPGAPLLRLDRAGRALAANPPGRLAFASTRDGLRAALQADAGPFPDWDGPGLDARLDPAGLRGATDLTVRRVAAALDAAGCVDLGGRLTLVDDTLSVEIRSRGGGVKGARSPVEPGWLDAVPASGVLAAWAVAVDPEPGALARAFAAVDAFERADPARAGVAPARTRLNLLAAAARVRPEADVWPHLRGVSGGVFADGGVVAGALLAVHLDDEAAARRFASEILPRLAAAYAAPAGDASRPLGKVHGRPLSAATRGRSVLVAWGEGVLDRSLDALDHPGRSAAAAVRSAWGATPPARAGAFWPRALTPAGSTPAKALADAPPLVWEGRDDGGDTRDLLRWPGLRGLVRRWLDDLPVDRDDG